MKKSKKTSFFVFSCISGMILGMQTAQAKQITFTGELCPLPVSAQASMEEEAVITEVSELDVLGVVDGFIAVALNDSETQRVAYVSEQSFTELIPGFDLSSLPESTLAPVLANASSGVEVTGLQEDLISLGYLDGEADGKFGPNTGNAVNKVKTEYQLAADGQADAVTQWLIGELADKKNNTASEPFETPYPPVYEVETKFASIYERTGADLSGFLTPDWEFDYDVFEGVGYIRNDTPVGTLSITEPTINRLELNADMQLAVTRDETGEVKVLPAVHVSTIGAYCPYLQTIQIKAGDEVVEVPVTRSERGVSGVDVTEEDVFALTQDAAQLLENAEIELVMRYNGTSQSYDMTVPEGQLTAFMEAVSEMVLASTP